MYVCVWVRAVNWIIWMFVCVFVGLYENRVKPHCFCLVVVPAVFFLFIILFGALCGAMYGGTHNTPHPTILAIAGGIIDCGKLDILSRNFLSALYLTQKVTDVVNDNPQGLAMKVKSFERSVVLNARNSSIYFEHTNVTLNKNYKIFIIPDGYYAYPPYALAGSNITVQVNLSNYNSLPHELLMYLIYGDLNYNRFSDDPSITPVYEQKFNLLGWDSQTYEMTTKNNGYYYVVIYVKTDNDIHFSATVNFNYYTISKGKLDFSDAHELLTTGTTVSIPVDHQKQQIVVCAVDGNPNLGAYTIHLQLDYSLRAALVYTIPLAVFFFYIPCVLFFFAVKKLWCYYRSPHRRHYQKIPGRSQFAVN